MSVIARGDVWVMVQVGEKDDFEWELTRLGFEHEHFERVERPHLRGPNERWDPNYAVHVTNVRTGQSIVYWGGPSGNWVVRFASELAHGAFGEPTIPPSHAIPWRSGT